MALDGVIYSVESRNGIGANSPNADNAKHSAEEDAGLGLQPAHAHADERISPGP